MSKTIQTGGMGKNPAIEKVNRMEEITNRLQASAYLERQAFYSETERAAKEKKKRSEIVDLIQISFLKKGETENGENI